MCDFWTGIQNFIPSFSLSDINQSLLLLSSFILLHQVTLQIDIALLRGFTFSFSI